jgi:hypothetical protein
MSDLEKVLPPAPVEVVVKGETFKVTYFGARQWAKALPASGLVLAIVEAVQSEAIDPVEAVVRGGEVIFELLALAINKPVDWFDDADPVEVCDLLLAVAEQNLDFFEQRVKPAMQPRKERAIALGSRLASKIPS